MRRIVGGLLLGICAFAPAAAAEPNGPPATGAVGVPVGYSLPSDGPLPKTYLVTLAIVDPQNPDWIVSQFVRGEPRTVTAENGGRFTETVGRAGREPDARAAGHLRRQGHLHAGREVAGRRRVPRDHAAVRRRGLGLDAVARADRQRARAVRRRSLRRAAGRRRRRRQRHRRLLLHLPRKRREQPDVRSEEARGLGQFLRAFASGGAGGGTSTCTDGESVWSFSTDGGPKYVYRADGKPFGTGRANRNDVYRPEGWVKAMACYREAGKSYVYVAQGGKIIEIQDWPRYVESDKEPVDVVSVHDGADRASPGRVAARRPAGHRGPRRAALCGPRHDGRRLSASASSRFAGRAAARPVADCCSPCRPARNPTTSRSTAAVASI